MVGPWALVRNADFPQAPPQTHWVRNLRGNCPAVCFDKPPGDSHTHYSLPTPSLDVQEMENVIFLIHIALQLVICAETHTGAPSSVLVDDSPRVFLTSSHLWHVRLSEPFLTRRWKVILGKANYLTPSSLPGSLFFPQRVCFLSLSSSVWNSWWELSHFRRNEYFLLAAAVASGVHISLTCHHVCRLSPW